MMSLGPVLEELLEDLELLLDDRLEDLLEEELLFDDLEEDELLDLLELEDAQSQVT